VSALDTAVILAAGCGRRLGEGGTSAPKGFLCLGSRPIIEESLDRLASSGIRRVVIVTGHRAEFYEELRARRSGLVETVHNPRYAESGSMVSLWCARELVAHDFLLLESDIIYERRALEVMLASEEPDVLLLSGFTGADDAVFVAVDEDDRLVAMSKDRSELAGRVAGELVGVTKVSRGLRDEMLAHAEARMPQTLHVAYETDALVAAARRRPVHCALVPDLLWAEIDHEEHLARAREEIHPLIVRREETPRSASS